MATLDYEQENQNEELKNSDLISCGQFENVSLPNDAWQSTLEKIHGWHESFASYVYFKEKIIGKLEKTDKKFEFSWLETNDLYFENVQTSIKTDRDYWISAAEVSERIKDKDGKPVLREKWITSMPCHFLILDLNEAVEAENLNLEFNLSGEQMTELVLEHCRQRGLPEPLIWGDHEELAVVWALEKPYEKGEAENFSLNSKGEIFLNEFVFNLAWNNIQNSLYEDFKYLGANPKKKHALTMFRVPGSFNTHANAPVRVFHDAEKTTVEEIKSGLNYVREKIKNREAIERPNLDDELNEFYRDNQEFLKFCDEIDGTDSNAPKPKIKKSRKNKKENPYVTPEDFERAKKNLEKLIAAQSEFLAVPSERSEEYKKFLTQLRQDVLQIHPVSDKYVCLSFKGEKESWRQIFVQAKNLEKKLTELWLKPDFDSKNIYVSQAEFLSDRSREISNVASLSVSFLDIDGKFATEQKNLTPEEWANLVLEECRKKEIPLPSIIVFSGNGLHVKWLYKEVITREKLDRWSRLQRRLWKIFKDLGADAQAKDAARVLRVAGTKNCKPETTDRDVRVVYSNSERYDFEKFSAKILHMRIYDDVQEESEAEKIEKPCEEKSVKKSRALSRSIAEFSETEINAVQGISCNYAVLSAEKISGATLKEKSKKIKARCAEYWNGFGFQIPNSIISSDGKLILVWKYSDYLPYIALSRWHRTQEIINYHFADWSAKNNAEISTPLLIAEFVDEKAEIFSLDAKYKFDDLATRVLIYSQKEVREYNKKRATEKAKAQAERTIKNLAPFKIAPKKRTSSFAGQAERRFNDIVKLIELRTNSHGEVPQGHRELSVFWALVFAARAGLIKDYKGFDALRVKLVDKNGLHFRIETYAAQFETLRNKFINGEELYKAKTETLIEALGITISEQAELEVLRYFPKKEKKEKKPSIESLAPWKDEGISRATWYRHKKKAQEAFALEEAEKKNSILLSVKMQVIILKVFLKIFTSQTPMGTDLFENETIFPYIMRGIERGDYYSYRENMGNEDLILSCRLLELFLKRQLDCFESFVWTLKRDWEVGLEKKDRERTLLLIYDVAVGRKCEKQLTRHQFFAFLIRPPPSQD